MTRWRVHHVRYSKWNSWISKMMRNERRKGKQFVFGSKKIDNEKFRMGPKHIISQWSHPLKPPVLLIFGRSKGVQKTDPRSWAPCTSWTTSKLGGMTDPELNVVTQGFPRTVWFVTGFHLLWCYYFLSHQKKEVYHFSKYSSWRISVMSCHGFFWKCIAYLSCSLNINLNIGLWVYL